MLQINPKRARNRAVFLPEKKRFCKEWQLIPASIFIASWLSDNFSNLDFKFFFSTPHTSLWIILFSNRSNVMKRLLNIQRVSVLDIFGSARFETFFNISKLSPFCILWNSTTIWTPKEPNVGSCFVCFSVLWDLEFLQKQVLSWYDWLTKCIWALQLGHRFEPFL